MGNRGQGKRGQGTVSGNRGQRMGNRVQSAGDWELQTGKGDRVCENEKQGKGGR